MIKQIYNASKQMGFSITDHHQHDQYILPPCLVAEANLRAIRTEYERSLDYLLRKLKYKMNTYQ